VSARSTRSLVVVWRDAVRDSKLAATTKLVAFVHSTYMDAFGMHSKSRARLAEGASCTDRTVDAANKELRGSGLLFWEEQDGGRDQTNGYVATMPETANELHRSEWQRAKQLRRKAEGNGEAHDVKGESHDVNGEGGSHEVVSRTTRRARARKGAHRTHSTAEQRLERWLEATGVLLGVDEARAVLEDDFHLAGADLDHALARHAHARVNALGNR
jgi:hypothetical protein